MKMVDSVDDLKSSCSVRGIQMPNFEVLDARIANQSGGTKGPEAGPLPSWQTDCLFDLRIPPGHWSP